jgi:hypothetical protein
MLNVCRPTILRDMLKKHGINKISYKIHFQLNKYARKFIYQKLRRIALIAHASATVTRRLVLSDVEATLGNQDLLSGSPRKRLCVRVAIRYMIENISHKNSIGLKCFFTGEDGTKILNMFQVSLGRKIISEAIRILSTMTTVSKKKKSLIGSV